MPKAERKSARDLRKLNILPILPRALERILSFYEITPGRCLIFPPKNCRNFNGETAGPGKKH